MTCGSCYAHASAGFLEDRLCIATNKVVTTRLAPQDMVNCDFTNAGCHGGFLTPSLNYLLAEGLVSEACLPYQSKMHFCEYRCSTGPSVAYEKHRCKAGSAKLMTSIAEMQLDIQTNGPIMFGFTMYADLLLYSSGVYEHVTGDVIGGHAVKVLGWAYDSSGKLYWLCQNQWGTSWGLNGYFKIYTGEGGIDLLGFSCVPDVI